MKHEWKEWLRRHFAKGITPRLEWAGVLVLCLLMMLISTGRSGLMRPIRTAFGIVVVPFQNGINSLGLGLEELKEKNRSKEALILEKEKLQDEIRRLKVRIMENDRKDAYLQSLEKLLKVKEAYPELDTVGAHIISRSGSSWYNTVMINKGSKDGIQPNMNVLADGGLYGIVTKTGEDYALVVPIMEDKNNVSAVAGENRDSMIIRGDRLLYAENRLRFSYLNGSSTVKEKDAVYTSDVSDRYVPGLLIGYVDKVTADARELTKSGTVVPAVDFEHVSDVLIVKNLKEKGDFR